MARLKIHLIEYLVNDDDHKRVDSSHYYPVSYLLICNIIYTYLNLSYFLVILIYYYY